MLLLGVPSVVFLKIRDAFGSAIAGVTLVYATSWLLIISFTILYRISPFHPLAKYPGPIACRISKLWLVYITMPGKSHHYIHRLHQTYGDIVRIGQCFSRSSCVCCSRRIVLGPNELSITHKDLATSVMSLKGLPRGPCECPRPYNSTKRFYHSRIQTSIRVSTEPGSA